MSRTLEIQVRVIRKSLSRSASRALVRVDEYDWILFTSKNTVTFFIQEMRKRRVALPKEPRIAAVGPETARALRKAGFSVDFVPKCFTVNDMIKGLGNIKGKHILFPRSAIVPQTALHGLRARGARVRVLPLYTIAKMRLPQTVKRRLLFGAYTQLAFKSPSGVYGLIDQFDAREQKKVRGIAAQCIGPTTAHAARAAGFKHVSIKGVL